jgi:hypothetical protein
MRSEEFTVSTAKRVSFSLLFLLGEILSGRHSLAFSTSSLRDFVKQSEGEPKINYLLIKGSTHCSPCLMMEKFTETTDLTLWPKYKAAHKLFFKVESDEAGWKAFSEEFKLPTGDLDAYPIIYVFEKGKLKVEHIASAPWQVERLLNEDFNEQCQDSPKLEKCTGKIALKKFMKAQK